MYVLLGMCIQYVLLAVFSTVGLRVDSKYTSLKLRRPTYQFATRTRWTGRGKFATRTNTVVW
jgi:hypothetical protein